MTATTTTDRVHNLASNSLEGLPITMKVEEAGDLLGLSRSAAYRAAKRGEMPTIRLSGRLHVPTAELLDMVGIDLP